MRFVSNWKITVLAVLAIVGTIQTGCTDREVAAGVGGAILGAVIVDSSRPVYYQPAPRRDCNRVTETQCWPAVDYYGRPAQACRTDRYSSCNSYKMQLTSNEISAAKVGDIAEAYKLTIDSAELLTRALTAARDAQDDESANAALQSICLTVAELKSIGKSGSLSKETVDCIAKTLNQDPSQTAMMVASITDTARAQEAARAQSHYNN